MAYAFVNEAGLDASSGATTIAVSLTCTAGNLIVIGATGDSLDSSNFAATPITDGGAGNTFAQLGSTLTTSNSQICGIFYARNCVGGSVTFTVNFPNSTRFRGIYVAQYSGVSTAVAIGTTGTNNTTGSGTDALASGNVNATSQPALVWGFDVDASGNTVPNGGTGFNQRSSAGGSSWTAGNVTCRGEDKRVTVTGNTQATFTNTTGSDVNATFVAVFAEAAGSQDVAPSLKPGIARPGRGPLSTGRFKIREIPAFTPANTDLSIALSGSQATFSAGNVAAIVPGAPQEESFGLARNRPGRGPFSKGKFFVGDYTAVTNNVPTTFVALSGVQTSFLLGAITPNIDLGLTGVSSTASPGTVGPNETLGLSGALATFQTGTLTASNDGSAALTGVLATFSAGALGPNSTVPLAGSQGTFGAGTLSPAMSVPLSGIQAVFVTGTITGSSPLPDLGGGAVMMMFTGFNRKRK